MITVRDLFKALAKVDPKTDVYFRTDVDGQMLELGMIALDEDGDVALYDMSDKPVVSKILKIAE